MKLSTILAGLTCTAMLLAGCGEPNASVGFDPGSGRYDPAAFPEGQVPTDDTPTDDTHGEQGESEPPPATAVSPITPGPSTPGPDQTTSSATSKPGEPRELGEGENAKLGQPYRFKLMTHCGIETTWWNGAWWNANPTQTQDGSPTAGWGDPYQDGVMIQHTQDRLEFTGDEGQRADFVPRPTAEGAPPPCD